MAKDYTKKVWKDRIVDSVTKEVLEEGTPVSASNLNHMEDGIELAHQKLEGANRQTVNISHGVQVINGDVDAPVSLQMEGRTLIPLQNTELDAAKYYVLADKKTKLKFSDSFSVQGVAKFPGVNAKVQAITRTATFENKVSGSTLENPHTFRQTAGAPLVFPASFGSELITSDYEKGSKLDGTTKSYANSINGYTAQQEFSFNIIEEIERNSGKIPRNTLAEKIQWCKDNINSLTINWHGFGSGPAGNKAILARFAAASSSYTPGVSTTNNTVTKLTGTVNSGAALSETIDPSGFAHYVACSDASDGVTASTINTDYIELIIELKPGVTLLAPKIPLYEVTKEHYDNILVTWNEDEVIRRYPQVEAVQHLQNPYVIAEGENLLPPFSEWILSQYAVLVNPYKITMSMTSAAGSYNDVIVPVIPNQNYTIQCDFGENPNHRLRIMEETGGSLIFTPSPTVNPFTFNVGNRTKVRIRLETNTASGEFSFSNPHMNIGDTIKPFVPRNPSYLFAEAKLGSLGTYKDLLYDNDGKMMVRKTIEKDIVIDGSLSWLVEDKQGFKNFQVSNFLNNKLLASYAVLTKYNGDMLKGVYSSGDFSKGDLYHYNSYNLIMSVADTDTGFTESAVPTADEIKAFFYGWQAKTSDANGKPTAWKSIVDGTDAPTQTLAYVSSNKAPGYIPYKITYVLAAPQLVEAKTEGSISVNGLTQIEVGSGVIVRERVTPQLISGTRYEIGHTSLPLSLTKNRISKIIGVYKNNQLDGKWIKQGTQDGYSYGLDRCRISLSDYDSTAEYAVTYLVYDRNQFTTNALSVLATFANNIRASLDDTVKKLEDVKTESSINTLLLYDVIKRIKAGGL